jgi:hypothetical protein
MNRIGVMLLGVALALLAWQIGPMWALIALLIYLGIALAVTP